MNKPAIEVHGLSKCYQLGAIGTTSLRDEAAALIQKLQGKAPAVDKREFWALRDVSFTIQPGEVVGFIGRNGAGKSTLLKLLSRITEPTRGRAIMRGRVASLLEVGTGFHPELSGRDNIFLNGAILGMTRAEVRAKFDEIVAFAEVGQFIDTPVKRYSSGMYVRLAFAVAAHLEPDILIVDEVLAVGDSEFQKKCLGKMQDVAGGGRTVLFVSHNIGAVTTLTKRCVLLVAGRLLHDGPTSVTLERYLEHTHSTVQTYEAPAQTTPRTHLRRVTTVTSEAAGVQAALRPLTIRIELALAEPLPIGVLVLSLINQFQQIVAQTHLEPIAPLLSGGGAELVCHFPSLRLAPGSYSVSIGLGERPGGRVLDQVNEVCGFEVARLGKGEGAWNQDGGLYLEDSHWARG